MSAEPLIALEAAVAELGTLYTAARGLTALAARAETELLPRLSEFAGRLRRLVRTGELTAAQIDAASQEILATRTTWRTALEDVRTSALYQRALAAFAADRQEELADVIPQVLAGHQVLGRPPALYFPFSPSTGRRRPGSSPFLSASACADAIVQVLNEGIVPQVEGTDWWERDLPPLVCGDQIGALGAPIALRLEAGAVRVAVFALDDEPTLRVFTPRLRAPLSVVLAAAAEDEWWDAYQDSYRAFRDALLQELAVRGQTAGIDDAACGRE